MEKEIDESKLIKSAAARRGSSRATSKPEANPVLGLHRSIGNRAVHRLLESGTIQAKLNISQPHDPDEIEADRIAERVTTSSSTSHVQRKCSCSGGSSCVECEDEKKGIHRKAKMSLVENDSLDDHRMTSLGPGQPLDGATRTAMESSLDHDFSNVRVHADAQAAESARSLNALAYTSKSDVVFGEGQYRPDTQAGKKLLAHELTHVAQQRAAPRLPPLNARNASATNEKNQRAQPIVQHRAGIQRQKGKSDTAATLTVVGHGVSESVVTLARDKMSEVLGNLKADNVKPLAGTTIELHIIPHDKKLTDLPEYKSLMGTKTFDGRLYDELRGAGGMKTGTTIRYAIAEEQLTTIAKGETIAGATGVKAGEKSAQQTTYAKGFIAGHESGHIVEQYALTSDQAKKLQKLYDERKKAGGPWLNPGSYTSSRKDEYFAQSVAAYFGHPYSTSDEDKKTFTRASLKKNDPNMHELLTTIFK